MRLFIFGYIIDNLLSITDFHKFIDLCDSTVLRMGIKMKQINNFNNKDLILNLVKGLN